MQSSLKIRAITDTVVVNHPVPLDKIDEVASKYKDLISKGTELELVNIWRHDHNYQAVIIDDGEFAPQVCSFIIGDDWS